MVILEAVWYLNGKQVYKVSPIKNLLCDTEMEDVNEIEVFDGVDWHSCSENDFEADDFEIRIKSNVYKNN